MPPHPSVDHQFRAAGMFANAPTVWHRQTVVLLITFIAGALSVQLLSLISPIDLGQAVERLKSYIEGNRSLSSAARIFGITLSTLLLLSVTLMIPTVSQSLRAMLARHRSRRQLAFSQTTSREAVVNQISEGLEAQLNRLVDTVSHYIDASHIQSASYENAKVSLETANTAEKIEAIVAVLMEASARGQSDVEQLRSSLNEAKAQSVELRDRLEKTEQLVSLDPLTELPNRRHFDTFLSDAIKEAHSSYLPLSIVMADIDHFKRLNDNYGHQTGDAVLKKFAKLLKSGVRSTDLVARYGGEEFVIVLKRSPLGTGFEVAENIRAMIASSKWVDPNTSKDIGRITASFGVAEIEDVESATELIERADKQLYAAKKNGRNRVSVAHNSQMRNAS